MMNTESEVIVSAHQLTKCFGLRKSMLGFRARDPDLSKAALRDVSFSIPRGRVVGLLGRNGSGKTTLLRCLQGAAIPTSGSAMLFGTEGAKLGDEQLSKLGVVHQETQLVSWMTGAKHLAFVQSFYESWDHLRAKQLIEAFELDVSQRIQAMSPGAIQKLAIISAACHHPQVLLLDEPAASLDPPGRDMLFKVLFDALQGDAPAIVISSHQLDDIERNVDWILCLDHGRIVEDQALDVLQERFSQWRVLPRRELNREWPPRFDEPWIRQATIDRDGALLLVEGASERQADFETRCGVVVQCQPVRLAQLFSLWTASGSATQPLPASTAGARP